MSLFHRWTHFWCLLFHKEQVAFENCEGDICHLHLINIISSIWINFISLTVSVIHRNVLFATTQAGDRFMKAKSIYQATVFSIDHTLSWLSNLLQSDFSLLPRCHRVILIAFVYNNISLNIILVYSVVYYFTKHFVIYFTGLFSYFTYCSTSHRFQ